MKMTNYWKGLVGAVAMCAATGVVDAVQQQAAASRREPQFENAQAKSWKSIILPNQPLSLHRHDHGRAIIALKTGTLDIVDAKGVTMKKMVWEAGRAYWYDADPPNVQHADLNRGKNPLEVIVVELQNP